MAAKRSKQKYAPTIIENEGQSIKLKHKITAKNQNQEAYIRSLRELPFTICVGPAGSGKTYLATCIAVEKLIAGEVERIILTRPVVEAGEKLGFLPGTLAEKLDPYLLPLMDAIEEHIGPQMTKRLVEARKIEIAPLAYMRGRSFHNCLPADHTVLLSSGENVRMDDLLKRFEAGEELEALSFNINTGEVEAGKIRAAFKQPNQHEKLFKITLENGEVIQATPDHKLYTRRGLVPTSNLATDDELVCIREDEVKELKIAKIEEVESHDDVFDIMVEGNHNFFTNAGVLSSNCIVLLDESQNTTTEQMRMFITRMGFGSIFLVNGDLTQSDLQKPREAASSWENGLQYIIRKLRGRDEKINYIEFENWDVVRSDMVKRIIALLDSPDTEVASA